VKADSLQETVKGKPWEKKTTPGCEIYIQEKAYPGLDDERPFFQGTDRLKIGVFSALPLAKSY